VAEAVKRSLADPSLRAAAAEEKEIQQAILRSLGR